MADPVARSLQPVRRRSFRQVGQVRRVRRGGVRLGGVRRLVARGHHLDQQATALEEVEFAGGERLEGLVVDLVLAGGDDDLGAGRLVAPEDRQGAAGLPPGRCTRLLLDQPGRRLDAAPEDDRVAALEVGALRAVVVPGAELVGDRLTGPGAGLSARPGDFGVGGLGGVARVALARHVTEVPAVDLVAVGVEHKAED